jgi:hypothetical protein
MKLLVGQLVKTVLSLVMELKQTTDDPYTRSPCLVYDLFALTPFENIHHFVMYALTFSF